MMSLGRTYRALDSKSFPDEWVFQFLLQIMTKTRAIVRVHGSNSDDPGEYYYLRSSTKVN